eukprot:s2308_g11.t1
MVARNGGIYTTCREAYDFRMDVPERLSKYPGFAPLNVSSRCGKLRIMPANGTLFKDTFPSPGFKFDPRVKMPYLSEAEMDASHRVVKLLRHQIGMFGHRPNSHNSKKQIKCDEGAWVDIHRVLTDYYIWEKLQDELGATVDRDHLNYRDAARMRFDKLVTMGWTTTRISNRTRWQILCVTVDQTDASEWDAVWAAANGGLQISMLTNSPLFVRPIAIRASTGHTQWKKDIMVPLDATLITHALTPGGAIALGACFHVATLKVLKSIIEHGIVPGGDGRERFMSYFSPFAPWDKEGDRILKTKTFYHEVRVALYIPPEAMVAFEARVDTDGRLVSTQTIPFTAVAGAWYEDNAHKWKRLLVPNRAQFIIGEVFASSSYASRRGLSNLATQVGKSLEDDRRKVAMRDIWSWVPSPAAPAGQHLQLKTRRRMARERREV